MPTRQDWHDSNIGAVSRYVNVASGAGVAMLEKDVSEGRQVKPWRRPRSVEFALAFHLGEEDDDGLLHE